MIAGMMGQSVFADGETKKVRPPPDYSGHVQLYEMPATISPPQTPVIPDDSKKVDSGSSPLPKKPTPSPLSLIPSPARPDGDAPPNDFSPGRVREMMNENWRNPDSKSGSTGWGWLANEIATNRARRVARQAEESRARDDEDGGETSRSGRQTNQTGMVQNTQRSDSGENNGNTAQNAALEPVLGWLGDLPSASPQNRVESSGDAVELARGVRDAANQDQDWSRIESYQGEEWNSSAYALPRNGLMQHPAEGDRGEREAREADYDSKESERRTNVADPRFSEGDRFGAEEPVSAFSGTPVWESSGFTPFSLAPAEPTAIEIPASSSLSSYPGDAPATPSLGGMGSERERATPKTLPW